MPQHAAGYVLAGGASRRMGSDKALLPYHGRTLVEHVASVVRDATGTVTMIGNPERYGHLGIPVLPDEQPGFGPLGGIITALAKGRTEWSLVVACDLPGITAGWLRELLAAAGSSPGFEALVPRSPVGLEPLCAIWHIAALPKLRCALESGRLKMKEVVLSLETRIWPVADSQFFRNINTPDDWAIGHE
jgi:molybdopterin-guanine dinucleotide biosynthesis protein A